MNDQPDPASNPPTQPLQPDPNARVLPPDPSLQQGTAATPPQERFVDRLWSLRSVIAVALASVIIGGLGGAALASAGDDQDGRGGPGHRFHRGGQLTPPGMQHRRSPAPIPSPAPPTPSR